MQLILILTVFSALFVSGCGGIPRPDTNLCIANVPLLRQKCYNLANDYDDNGYLKPDAKAQIRQYKSPVEMLDALNKSTNTDPMGWANLKAFIKNLKDLYKPIQK